MHVCVCVRVYLLYTFFHFYSYLRTIQVYYVYYLFHFDVAFTNDMRDYRSSRQKVFLRKGILKICCKFKG